MQISKFLLAAGTVGVLVAAVPAVAAPDTAAQAKMREALRQKMEEVNAQTAAPAAAPAASKPAPAATVPQTAPVARPATVVVPVPVEPAPVVTPAAVSATKSGSVGSTFSEVPVEGEDAKVARLQEAMRQQLAAEKAAAAAAPPVALTAPVTSAVKSAPVVAAPITANMEIVPSPFSGSKQERLAELLRRYKADEITPQEYHTKRAAIIAEP